MNEKDSFIQEQVGRLDQIHFLIMYWAARARDLKKDYNVTNVFDDLKAQHLTRTKQSAVSFIESLYHLAYIDLLMKANKKTLYLREEGLAVLELLVRQKKFNFKQSQYLES